MSSYKKINLMKGYATSLADNPCINLCGNVVVGGNGSCKYCGRTQEQITHWQTYPVMVKKLINLENYDKHASRQRITALAEEYDISFETARQIFAVDGHLSSVN